ncbi:MAG: DUF4405 domain-containing protein [Gammaproteobacteria bacterium]|nr:DUF4405 domain-containing protein [Gammaproteobacteria bacterium]
MNRRKIIIAVDVLAFAGLVLLVSTGVLMEYLLPPGSGRWATIWTMDRHEWGDIHFWVACFFFAVLVVHLLLHWRFIVSRFKVHSDENSIRRVALGLLGLLGLIAIAVAPLLSPIENNAEHQRDHRGPPVHKNR